MIGRPPVTPEDSSTKGRQVRLDGRHLLKRLLVGGLVSLLLAYMFAPLIVVVGVAFNPAASLSFPPHGMSLRWFKAMIEDPEFRTAVATSLKIAGAVAVTSTLIGTAFAFAATRRSGRVFAATATLAMAPVVLPGIFIGIALYCTFLYTQFGMSARTAVVGQLVYVVPFVILVLDARLRDFDLRLEEAARVLGYSPASTLVLVTLRIIFPAIVVAFVLALATSLDEFFITYWVIGQDTTLPIYILSHLRIGIDPRMNAVATMLLIIPVLILLGYALRRIFRKPRRRET